MSNKNSETEKKTQMSNEEMEKFVSENLSIVPRNWRKKFDLLTLEQKVAKIRFYFDQKKLKDEMVEKNKLENKVKELFIKRKVTTEDVVRVMDFCKEYIQSTKEEEINKLQTEIERLTHLKQSLENN